MVLPLPHPVAVVDAVFATAEKALTVATTIAATPARLLRLIDNAELLLARASTAVDAAGQSIEAARGAIENVRTITAAVAPVVQEAAQAAATAGALIKQATQTAETAHDLITAYEPAARKFVEHLSSDEVNAAIRLTDELPKLAHHLNADVMPILATLDRVGPDIHELLGVTRDVRQAIAGIPGFGMLRRRGEDKDAD